MERKTEGEVVHKISITRLRDIFADKGFGSDDMVMSPMMKFRHLEQGPSVIDGITIGIVSNGKAKASINGRRHELKADSLFLLREDSVIESFKCSKACMGYMMTYSRTFLNTINISAADFLSVYMIFSTRPCIALERDDADRMYRIGSLLTDVARSAGESVYGNKIVQSLFSAFFYSLVSILNRRMPPFAGGERNSRSDELLMEFFRILGEECERERSVEYYASKMGISPKYLSLVCKKKTGRNASKIIDDVVIHKAKELLKQTGLSIQEVADRLNFVSQSFFGKYFKQRVGISPSRYKVHE